MPERLSFTTRRNINPLYLHLAFTFITRRLPVPVDSTVKLVICESVKLYHWSTIRSRLSLNLSTLFTGNVCHASLSTVQSRVSGVHSTVWSALLLKVHCRQ